MEPVRKEKINRERGRVGNLTSCESFKKPSSMLVQVEMGGGTPKREMGLLKRFGDGGEEEAL